MPTLTIDFNAQQAARFAATVTDVLGLDHLATFAECRQFELDRMKQLVLEREEIARKKAAALAVVPFDLV